MMSFETSKIYFSSHPRKMNNVKVSYDEKTNSVENLRSNTVLNPWSMAEQAVDFTDRSVYNSEETK